MAPESTALNAASCRPQTRPLNYLELNLTVLTSSVDSLYGPRRRPAILAVTFEGIDRREGFALGLVTL